MKVCKKCGGSDWRGKRCRPCWAAYMKVWVARNPEKKKLSDQKGWQKNRNKRLKKKREYAAKPGNRERHSAKSKEWYEANREHAIRLSKEAAARRRAADPEGFKKKRAEAAARRRREDPQALIYSRMGCLVRQNLKKMGRDPKTKAGRRWTELTGYSVAQLEERLKQTIPEGFTWDDYLTARLQIDHIIPDKDFEYRSVDDQGFKASWALTNLRLLTKEANNARNGRRG